MNGKRLNLAAALLATLLLMVRPAAAAELESAPTASRPAAPALTPTADGTAPPAAAQAPPAVQPSRRYLGLVLAANVVGAVGTAYLAIKTPASAYTSLIPYMVASPLVHLGYGNPGRATLSLLAHGIPILTTLGGAYLDSRLFPCNTASDPIGNCDVPAVAFTLLGLTAGVGLAGLIDVALASRAPATQTSPPPPPPVSLSFAPRLLRGGGVLGISGAF